MPALVVVVWLALVVVWLALVVVVRLPPVVVLLPVPADLVVGETWLTAGLVVPARFLGFGGLGVSLSVGGA